MCGSESHSYYSAHQCLHSSMTNVHHTTRVPCEVYVRYMWWQYLGYLGKLSEHPACLECLHSFEGISRVFKIDKAISFGRAERRRRGGRRGGEEEVEEEVKDEEGEQLVHSHTIYLPLQLSHPSTTTVTSLHLHKLSRAGLGQSTSASPDRTVQSRPDRKGFN